MNMVTIVCPKCSAEGKLSLVETNYVGPRRCWKCHELFTITIVNNKVQSSEPLSQEEYDRQEAKKASEKGIQYKSASQQDNSDVPQITPERRRNYNQPVKSAEPASREEPEKPPAPKTPPDRFRTFVPMEESSREEPEKPRSPQTPKTPPDRFRTFIPPAT
jgi:hypothetical protein